MLFVSKVSSTKGELKGLHIEVAFNNRQMKVLGLVWSCSKLNWKIQCLAMNQSTAPSTFFKEKEMEKEDEGEKKKPPNLPKGELRCSLFYV